MQPDDPTETNQPQAPGAGRMQRQASGAPPLLIAGTVLAIGLLLSFMLSRHAESNFTSETQARFEAGSSLALAGVQRRIDELQAVLLGMQGLFIASEHIDRREFQLQGLPLEGQA